jgi:hypothetical protein
MFLPKKTNWKQHLPASFLSAAAAYDGTHHPSAQKVKAVASFAKSAARPSVMTLNSFAAAAAAARRKAIVEKNLLAKSFSANVARRLSAAYGRADAGKPAEDLLDSAARYSSRLPYIFDRNLLRNGGYFFYMQNQWLDAGKQKRQRERREAREFYRELSELAGSFNKRQSEPAVNLADAVAPEEEPEDKKSTFLANAESLYRRIWADGPISDKLALALHFT